MFVDLFDQLGYSQNWKNIEIIQLSYQNITYKEHHKNIRLHTQ